MNELYTIDHNLKKYFRIEHFAIVIFVYLSCASLGVTLVFLVYKACQVDAPLNAVSSYISKT